MAGFRKSLLMGRDSTAFIRAVAGGTYSGVASVVYRVKVTKAGQSGTAEVTVYDTAEATVLNAAAAVTSGAAITLGTEGATLTLTWSNVDLRIGMAWDVYADTGTNTATIIVEPEAANLLGVRMACVDPFGAILTRARAELAVRNVRLTSLIPPSTPVSNGDFASATNWTVGTGWAVAGNKATHTAASGTAALSQDVSAKIGQICTVTFTISGRTAGSVTMGLGGRSGVATGADGVYTQTLAALLSTAGIAFTPVTGFDGSVSVVSIDAHYPVALSNAHGMALKNLHASLTVQFRTATSGDYDQVGPYGTDDIRPPHGELAVPWTTLQLKVDGTWGQVGSALLRLWEEA